MPPAAAAPRPAAVQLAGPSAAAGVGTVPAVAMAPRPAVTQPSSVQTLISNFQAGGTYSGSPIASPIALNDTRYDSKTHQVLRFP